MTTQTQERTIPLPPEFPVEWPDPADAERFWERELMHVPMQTTVMDDAFQQRWIGHGFNAACADYSFPIRNRYQRFNTYTYQSIAPVSHDPAELEALGQEAERRLGAVFGRQLERWETEFRPEIERSLAFWDGFDLDGAPAAELAAHVRETAERSTRAWHVHFVVAFPTIFAMSVFADRHRAWLGGTAELDPYRLVQGQMNHSIEVDDALWSLARQASPAVIEVLRTHATEQARTELAASEDGREFLAALDAYLDQYGRRQDGYISVSKPSWRESPGPVLASLVSYATEPRPRPTAGLAELAAERDRLTDEARARLAGGPPEAAGEFEFLLDAARQASVLQEDHNFWIDGKVVYSVRRVMLAAGRRLAGAGVLEIPDDVFHLDLDELSAALDGGPEGLGLGERVAARTAELERFRAVSAPPVLGTLPPGPPPDDAFTRAILRFFGGPPRADATPAVVTGQPGSPGVVRGIARVIRSLDEADRLAPGEILVTATTSPPWTPLFRTAAAVVTDVGGVLSHCAVVAREYMIPAVVATHGGSSAIQDGQLIEVNGDEGTVTILGAA
jgi:phosphohistidine swiveling domain-containing protein